MRPAQPLRPRKTPVATVRQLLRIRRRTVRDRASTIARPSIFAWRFLPCAAGAWHAAGWSAPVQPAKGREPQVARTRLTRPTIRRACFPFVQWRRGFRPCAGPARPRRSSRIEALPVDKREQLRDEGYIEGAAVSQPSVFQHDGDGSRGERVSAHGDRLQRRGPGTGAARLLLHVRETLGWRDHLIVA